MTVQMELPTVKPSPTRVLKTVIASGGSRRNFDAAYKILGFSPLEKYRTINNQHKES